MDEITREDVERAERLLLEALECDRNHARAIFAYGMLLGRCMIAPESQIALEKAIALDRNYAAAMLQLGYTLYGRNKSTLIPSELTTGFPLVQTLIPSQTRVRCRAKPEAPDLRQELPLRARKRSLQRP